MNIIPKQKSWNVAGSSLQSAARWLMTNHIKEDISEEKTTRGSPSCVNRRTEGHRSRKRFVTRVRFVTNVGYALMYGSDVCVLATLFDTEMVAGGRCDSVGLMLQVTRYVSFLTRKNYFVDRGQNKWFNTVSE